MWGSPRPICKAFDFSSLAFQEHAKAARDTQAAEYNAHCERIRKDLNDIKDYWPGIEYENPLPLTMPAKEEEASIKKEIPDAEKPQNKIRRKRASNDKADSQATADRPELGYISPLDNAEFNTHLGKMQKDPSFDLGYTAGINFFWLNLFASVTNWIPVLTSRVLELSALYNDT